MRAWTLAVMLCACGGEKPGEQIRGSFRWVEDNGWRTGAASVLHDDARSVTCWQTYYGISCLPDSQLASPEGHKEKP